MPNSYSNIHQLKNTLLRYFLHLSYKGKDFHGWQNQTDVTTVQEVLEYQLSKMLGVRTTCHGCGRTDAGVNASQYFCNITITKELDYDFVFRINKMLPASIVVYDLIPVAENANTQYDALKRTYDYFFHFEKNPFLDDISSFYEVKNLDIDSMEKTVKLLLGKKDFKAFCISPDVYHHTLCEVSNVNLIRNESLSRMRFQITADRFLRGMVRILAANLLRIGEGKMSVDEFEYCLVNREKPKFHNIAFPQGLYLSKIEYSYIDIKPRRNILDIDSKY